MGRPLVLATLGITLLGCERPRSIDTPDAPEAHTLIYVELAEGRPPSTVWVVDAMGDGPPSPFTLATDQVRYVLWHRRSPARLGLALGENRVMPGDRSPLPPDGVLRLEPDGRWAEVETAPGPLLALPIFQPRTRCERIEEAPPEPWPDLPELLDASPIDANTALLTTRDRRVMRLDASGGVLELLSSPAPILAAAQNGENVYALDADLRLLRRDGDGTPTTTTTTLAALPLPFDFARDLAALAVTNDGSVHLYLDYTRSSLNTERRVSVLRLVGSTFEPWTDGTECGGRDDVNNLVSPARRLATAGDGESVLAGAICANGILRWSGGGAPPALERIDQVGVVRRLGRVLYTGRVGETVLANDAEGGGWRMVYRSIGGRNLEDLAEFPGGGLVLAGYNNGGTRLTLVLPDTAEEATENCSLVAAWPGRTRAVVRVGDHYLIVPDVSERPEPVSPQRLLLRYIDD